MSIDGLAMHLIVQHHFWRKSELPQPIPMPVLDQPGQARRMIFIAQSVQQVSACGERLAVVGVQRPHQLPGGLSNLVFTVLSPFQISTQALLADNLVLVTGLEFVGFRNRNGSAEPMMQRRVRDLAGDTKGKHCLSSRRECSFRGDCTQENWTGQARETQHECRIVQACKLLSQF